MPYETSPEAKTTDIWRFIFCVPAAMAMVQFFLFQFVYPFETPIYYAIHKDYKGYEDTMNRFYRPRGNVKDSSALLEEKAPPVLPKLAKELTWGEAISQPYKTALVVAIMLGVYNQATGIGFVTFYENEIFDEEIVKREYLSHEAELKMRQGTFGTAFAAVIAGAASYITSIYYGRKPTLIGGEIAMTICLVFLWLCQVAHFKILTAIVNVIFIMAFYISTGAILWLYVSEICGPKGIAISVFVHLTFTLFIGFIENVMYRFLTSTGVYIMLVIIQVSCLAFLYSIKETRGTSYDEAKSLYFANPIKEGDKKEENEDKDIELSDV